MPDGPDLVTIVKATCMQAAQRDAERAACVDEKQRSLEAIEPKLRAVQAEHVYERENALNMQRPNSATTVKPEISGPDRATIPHGVINGNNSRDVVKPGLKNLSEVALEQLRATLPEVDFSRLAASSRPPQVKVEANSASPNATNKNSYAPAPRAVHAVAAKKVKVKTERTKDISLGGRTRKGDPSSSDSSSSSSSSDEDSGTSSSVDSLDVDATASAAAHSMPKSGATTLNVYPYVNSHQLAQLNEKASWSDRRSWWERFLNMAI
ncbi:hypothetical protein GQ600_22012 [Phytophthora cactorum]|nr:hypothetical protein GQ600_22012 [Phytophthora cactorum]